MYNRIANWSLQVWYAAVSQGEEVAEGM
jgi:hypothetical protein